MQPQPLPAGLAGLPPGPGLAAALASVDPARLSGSDCVQLLQATYRQVNHDRARLLSVIAEVVVRDEAEGLARFGAPLEFCYAEVRAALAWTRRYADRQCELAVDLHRRLPAVQAALAAGVLDEAKARIFCEWTIELTDQQAHAVCAALLPRAPGWTTGQLVEQIKRYAMAIDPDWAGRRYAQAVATRRVIGRRNPDGSADLCGLNLPVEQVAAACARIDRLAKAAKHAGQAEPIDQIRADLFLGLTDGSYAGLDDDAILAILTAGPASASPVDAVHDRTTVVDRHADPSRDAAGTPDRLASVDSRTDPQPTPPAGVASTICPVPDSTVVRTSEVASEPPSAPPLSSKAPIDAVSMPRRFTGWAGRGVELRVKLSTVLGHDEHPGELAGWGPIHADLARQIATDHTAGRWHYVITDADGHPIQVGLLRCRPTGGASGGSGGRATVEIQTPLTLLPELDGHDHGAWTRLVNELAAHATQGGKPARGDDPARRTPDAALRRLVQTRDRTCLFPGCRTPARHTDTDHRVDHARGGPTIQTNLGSLCRRDHLLKHQTRWRLTQPQAGRFLWISPLGHTYPVRPPPVIQPLPDPIPRTDSPPTTRPPSDVDWQRSVILEPPPAKPPPKPPPEDIADDPPPF
jgi:hypothetical protein